VVSLKGQGRTSAIEQTQAWVESVVVGLNLCPFAGREVERGSVHYAELPREGIEDALLALMLECDRLDKDPDIATSLLVFSKGFRPFDDFLDLLELAGQLLIDRGYEGVYQLASFHPEYCFEGADEDDPANYTNRAPYPTLHLIREESLASALALYPNPEEIPERNIEVTRDLGLEKMHALLMACYGVRSDGASIP
jgi:hypothetical protein